MTRRPELDALRGVMLVLMTVTHMPTRFADPVGQPFGFVSAAEGFVFLSAFMAGWVYSELARRSGPLAMWRAFEWRALKIYLCQAALLLFLFTAIAWLGIRVEQPAVTNLIAFYLDDPWLAARAALVMLYNPPLLDILPMYVLFMLLSPFVLTHAMRRGWAGWLAASLALWLCAQFDAWHGLYELMAAHSGLRRIPFTQTGAFDPLAWQFLWMFGLCFGAKGLTMPLDPKGAAVFPRWLLAAALSIAVTGFAWRHLHGQTPFLVWREWNVVFDKWHLGPLRVLNLLALIVLALRFGPRLLAWKPRWRVLETLGASSLSIFCAHLVLVLLALALFGASDPARPVWLDVALLAGTYALLYGLAMVLLAFDAWRKARRGKSTAAPSAATTAVRVATAVASTADGIATIASPEATAAPRTARAVSAVDPR